MSATEGTKRATAEARRLKLLARGKDRLQQITQGPSEGKTAPVTAGFGPAVLLNGFAAVQHIPWQSRSLIQRHHGSQTVLRQLHSL